MEIQAGGSAGVKAGGLKPSSGALRSSRAGAGACDACQRLHKHFYNLC